MVHFRLFACTKDYGRSQHDSALIDEFNEYCIRWSIKLTQLVLNSTRNSVGIENHTKKNK